MPFVTPLRPDDPRRVGRYRLAGRIADQPGAPEAARTFLARLPDGTPVAVSLLGRASAPDAASRDRFSAEASAARRVAPFCTARILDAGFDADQPYLVSEFIEGPSLAEAVRNEGPLEPAVLAAVAIGAATGLASIHQAGLVHGEFGPDHVVLGADGPRVVNFSITPPYGAATPSADLLAWARTVMFAAGADGPGGAGVAPDTLPEPLRAVVPACLAADAATRPAARAIVTALLGQGDPPAGLLAEGARRARAAGRGVTSAAAGPPDEAPPRSASRRLAWAAGFTACLAAIAVAGTLIAHPSRPPRPGPAVRGRAPLAPGSRHPPGLAHARPGRPGGAGRLLDRDGAADRPLARGDRPDPAHRGFLGRHDLLPAARLLGPPAAGVGRGQPPHPGAGHHQRPAELQRRGGDADRAVRIGRGVQLPAQRRAQPVRRPDQIGGIRAWAKAREFRGHRRAYLAGGRAGCAAGSIASRARRMAGGSGGQHPPGQHARGGAAPQAVLPSGQHCAGGRSGRSPPG